MNEFAMADGCARSPRGKDGCVTSASATHTLLSRFDLRAKHLQELGQPLRMSRPCWSGNKVPVNMSLVHGPLDPLAASALHVWADRGIGRAGFALQHTCRRQKLRSVANGGNRLIALGKVTHDLNHLLVQA